MCSVSWQQQHDEILICFNRDEQKNRIVAEPPRIFSESSISTIMPIDPQGGGSWISVNQFGLFLGLLNFYDVDTELNRQKIAHEKYISRGLLLRRLSVCKAFAEVAELLSKQDLTHYMPFKLVVILDENKKLFVWNGVGLSVEKLEPFICSSSIESRSVLKYRQQQFSQAQGDIVSLHREHTDRKDSHSICMHRDDAETVSLSVIRINSTRVSFEYWNGSPCSSQTSELVSLEFTGEMNLNSCQNDGSIICQNA